MTLTGSELFYDVESDECYLMLGFSVRQGWATLVTSKENPMKLVHLSTLGYATLIGDTTRLVRLA